MLDSVKRPATKSARFADESRRASLGGPSHRTPLQANRDASSLEERLRTHHEKEKKLWFAIIGTCVVVIGVWVLTFQMPQTKLDPSGGSISELKSIVEDVVSNTKEGWKGIQAQKPSTRLSSMSDQKLSELARELVAGATTSTTTLLELPASTSASLGGPASKGASLGGPNTATVTNSRLP